MKIKYILLYMLYILFGSFTIMFIGFYLNLPVWISYLIGSVWGFIVGTDIENRIK